MHVCYSVWILTTYKQKIEKNEPVYVLTYIRVYMYVCMYVFQVERWQYIIIHTVSEEYRYIRMDVGTLKVYVFKVHLQTHNNRLIT